MKEEQIILTVSELEKLYNSMTGAKLAQKLNICQTHLNKLLNKHGIKKKGKGNCFRKVKIIEG